MELGVISEREDQAGKGTQLGEDIPVQGCHEEKGREKMAEEGKQGGEEREDKLLVSDHIFVTSSVVPISHALRRTWVRLRLSLH